MNIRRKVVIHIDNQTQQPQTVQQPNPQVNQPSQNNQPSVSTNNSDTPRNSSFPKGVLVIVLILVIIAGAVALSFSNNSENNNEVTTPPITRNEDTDNSSTDSESVVEGEYEYVNGTYEATGEYISPGGRESLDVTLTLEEGIITDIEVVPQAKLPISAQMQADFVANYKPMVQGRNIDEVRLSKVSGSSLTSGGFNDALDKIKSQARS